MADKVRYYMESSVPELQDLQKKQLFDKKEITMIIRRRTDFEHRLSGRASSPSTYLRYIQFEKNLEKLRKKRIQRLKDSPNYNSKLSISDFAATKRILFIFDRSVQKFPKDLSLWSNYLKFAKKNGSIKIIYKIYSQLLKLQPKNSNAWLSAAYYEFEINKNPKGCRNLLQKSLRFNPESLDLWLNYFKFEMNYLSKLLNRRKLLNLITEKQQLSDQLTEENAGKENDGESDDIISLLPEETLKNQLNSLPDININMLGSIESNPVLKGDLIITIFDVCINTLIKEFNLNQSTDPERYSTRLLSIINQILNLIDQYPDLQRLYLAQYIIDYASNNLNLNQDPNVILLQLTLILRYIDLNDLSTAISNIQISVKNYIKLMKSIINDNELKLKIQTLYLEFLNTKVFDQILENSDNDDPTINKLIDSLNKKCKLI